MRPKITVLIYLASALNPGLFVDCKAQEKPPASANAERLHLAKVIEQQAIATHDTLLLAEAWHKYGSAFELSDDFQTSQRYFLKTLQLLEPRGDSPQLSRVYARLSNYELIQHNYPKAIEYATLSLKIAQRIHSDPALIRSYHFLGRAYKKNWSEAFPKDQAMFNQAMLCLKHAEKLCLKIQDTLGIAELKQSIGELFLSVHNTQAIPYLEESLRLFSLKNKQGMLPGILNQLSAGYLLLGHQKEAWQAIVKAEIIYRRNKLADQKMIIALANSYAAYYEATHQFRKALDYHKKAERLERQQLLADQKGMISRLNIEYETHKKETLLKARNQELAFSLHNNQIQQYFIILLVGLFLLAIWLSIIFYRLYQKNQRISWQNKELVKEQNHRVKNNLQMVASLLSLQLDQLTDPIAQQAVIETNLRIQSMAIVQRRLYDGDMMGMVNLHEFVQELVELVLRTYGYPNQLVKYSIEPLHLPADKAISLGLILNELVTNACKYAFPNTSSPKLSISCRYHASNIQLKVDDNGPGFRDSPIPSFQSDDVPDPDETSIGLSLIHMQALQLNGKAQFNNKTSGGAVFTLSF